MRSRGTARVPMAGEARPVAVAGRCGSVAAMRVGLFSPYSLTRPGGVIELGSGAVAASAGAASPLPSGSLPSGSLPASAVVGPN